MTISLKTCPCCAQRAGFERVEEKYRAYCFGCGLNTILHDSAELAARAWNMRANGFTPSAKGAWKTRAEQNRDRSTDLLRGCGVAFDLHNDGYHLIVTAPRGLIDFWPSTGRFQDRRTRKMGRGVKSLLEMIGRQQVEGEKSDA